MTGTDGVDQLDLLPEAVVLLDVDEVVTACNDRARDLLGVPDGAIGRSLTDVLTLRTEDGAVCERPVPSRGVADRVAERLWWIRLPDGRTRTVAMAGRFLDGGGVALTFRSADRRRAVDEARSDVVAQVSHEVRMPLATIAGAARTLEERGEDLSADVRGTLLEMVVRDAERVTQLLDDLLVVARIDAGRMRVRREAADVADIARSVVAKARLRDRGAGRDLAIEVDPGTPSRVLADPMRVEQVLTNLVENALVHAPGATVRVSVGPTSGGVAMRVVDDGPGVPAEVHERIFTKFGRGRDSRRAGTGLGLYISRGLARAHGGDLTLDVGTDQGGAAFTFTLPDPPVAQPG